MADPKTPKSLWKSALMGAVLGGLVSIRYWNEPAPTIAAVLTSTAGLVVWADFHNRKLGQKSQLKKILPWVIWWLVDKAELAKQVAEYNSLGWFRAARKISVLCLLLSVAFTVAATIFDFTDVTTYGEAVAIAVLAIFIYRGHRWAMIAAMALWTFEKIYTATTGFGTFKASGYSLISSFFLWTAFMHAFYLAFRVEQARKKLPAAQIIDQSETA